MREIVFRVLAERPGHMEAQAVGAAFSAGVTLPIRITAPTLEELQHEAREALINQLGHTHCTVRVRVRREPVGDAIGAQPAPRPLAAARG
jgi:hypothetical protein